jgi:hypothetical protein
MGTFCKTDCQEFMNLLDCIQSKVDQLRIEPGYKGTKCIADCVEQLERLLEKRDVGENGGEEVENRVEMQIPTSPLLELLRFYQSQHTTTTNLYESLLSIPHPTLQDLKSTRQTASEIHTVVISSTKLQQRIKMIDGKNWNDWSINDLVSGLVWISRTLFQSIDFDCDDGYGSVLRSREVFQFLSFQEYLYSILSSYIHTTYDDSVRGGSSSLTKNEKINHGSAMVVGSLGWLVDLSYMLLFVHQDISTSKTILQVLDDFLYSSSSMSKEIQGIVLISMLENQKYQKLQKTMFADESDGGDGGAIEIEMELVDDIMNAHHRVIPTLQVAIDHVLEHGTTKKLESLMMKYKRVAGVVVDCGEKKEDLIHFLVTRVVDCRFERGWWKKYCTDSNIVALFAPICDGDGDVGGGVEDGKSLEGDGENVEKEDQEKVDEEAKAENQEKETTDPDPNLNDINAQLFHRFQQLSNKPPT